MTESHHQPHSVALNPELTPKCEGNAKMWTFAHHMGVELFGHEFSPHGVVQHICTFAALSFLFTTSAIGTWMLAVKARQVLVNRRSH